MYQDLGLIGSAQRAIVSRRTRRSLDGLNERIVRLLRVCPLDEFHALSRDDNLPEISWILRRHTSPRSHGSAR